MTKTYFPVLPLLTLALSSAVWACPCSEETASKSDKSASVAATIRLSDENAGQTATLKSGDLLEVRLVSNPTTGYSWIVAHTDAKILPIEGKTEFVPPNTDREGAPGLQIWRFKALKAGQVKLELHYLRSWEKVKPVKTWTSKVEVK